MATRLGDLLDDARRRTFVGRRRELASFDDVLLGRSARRVLLVHGPGGIGKTTLLLEYRTRARAASRTVLLLDAREVDPSPEGFENAMAAAAGQPMSVLPDGAVLLVDGYEQLGPIDGWLRQAFLPAMPADCVVVLAGREAPAAPWRSDPGWRSVVGVLRLGDLDEAESGELLERAGVAAAARPQLVRLGRGHPLAMALLADIAVTGTVPDRLAEVPDLVAALLESLLRGAPADAHMTGLAACAKAWLTTEDLLRQVVGAAAGEVWTWLERRPFVTRGPNGLFPHDLARDVLDAEFERRWPERYRALHRVVHDHMVASLRSAAGPDRQMLAQQLLYLHRKSPFSEVIGALRARGSAAVVPARRPDHEPALSLIEHFEGPRSARLAERWFAEQPEGLNVVRDDQGLAGFVFHVMHPTGSPMEDRDPVTRAVLDHATRQGPARPGEQIYIGRFLAGRRGYPSDPYAVLAAPVSSLFEWVTRPLAWSFVAVTDEATWGPIFDYIAFTRQLEVEFDGLSTAVLLARDGHQVTVLERDPDSPPEPAQAWQAWERRGVNQFRLPHAMLPPWRARMERELPEVLDEVLAAGGLRLDTLAMLPESRRGPRRDGDERFVTITARRPVLEAALAAVAGRTPGVTIRRGVAVTGLLADSPARACIAQVRGVLAAGGQALRADLVVDCCGRRSPLGSWLEAIGAPRPAEERENCGFFYYGRHFRTRTGELPRAETNLLQHYDSVSVLTLPGDNGTWSVVFTTAGRDRQLHALREPDRWDAALARYPLAAQWRDGEPITGVDVMAGIEDRHRRLVVDGVPVATGVVAVGDAWACTNPSLGRGATIGLLHACALRDVLRDVDAGDLSGDPEKLVRRFDEVTAAVVEPLYRMTLWFDRNRLAELAADAAGAPGQIDDPRWAAGKALFAASLADEDLIRDYMSVAMLLSPADEVFGRPGMAERVMRLGAHAPRYPLPGLSRRELLAAIGG